MSEAVLSANLTVLNGWSSRWQPLLVVRLHGAQKGNWLIFQSKHTGIILVTFGVGTTTMGEVGRVIFSY